MSHQSVRTRTAVQAVRDSSLRLEKRGVDVAGELFRAVLLLCIVLGVLMLATLLAYVTWRGWPRLDLNLFTQMPSSIDLTTAGFLPAIVGTIWIMLGVLVTVVPLGVSAALYLEEYADTERWWNRAIEVFIQNLAAVPSIVFGILGLAFIVRAPLALGPVAFAGSLTLTMLVLPTVIIASREAIRAVPSTLRQASMALGASKWQTVWRQVIPGAVPGILTGTILSMSRAIGETAPLLLVGATTFVQFLPEGPLEGRYTAIPVQIFQWVVRPQEEFRVLAAAGCLVLVVLLLLMNSVAIWLRARFSRES
ncbi:phosphate ABC transporter permease PstA [Myceligenerans pegani]|uniref:Phosphate transport system permease protein PstA n=1 Tax=Myceligenerans pegani TaxID=2776917 RepID=A0ABR9N3E3_9MICO|nr:phosphate ABC transporter permease PstA [Myceligenerans sp. TRM 65318]MBE1878173.1 phosphate ABC transporter permease PstA [Myceligenerans sp. TRM 65318]MBE3020444.1 phosphate ABC transporter permease PstA [Myceligenerans sp. TRM 65318]